MDFSSGYSASFYATFVDPYTWLDTGRFEIVNGSINRDNSELRQSASLTVREWNYDSDIWIRVYMDVNQNGDRAHIPLFTGLASSPDSNFNNGVIDANLQCYSVLKPLDDTILRRGWYALKGRDGATVIKDLLNKTYAPSSINSDKEAILSKSIVSEDNESSLSMIESILTAIGWSLTIDGLGNIILSEFSVDPVAYFSSNDFDVIETSFSVTNDWFECPNCILVTSGDNEVVVKDESDESRFSTVNRGREIWYTENEALTSENESLTTYARRRLKELQQQTEKVEYSRRFVPNVYPDNMIRINYPELNGDYYVESQTINLSAAAQTNESIFRYIGD